MTKKNRQQFAHRLMQGLELAEYRLLKEKALQNKTIIQSNDKGGYIEVPARVVFEQLYHETVK
ncbi:MAG: hypothetical protein ACI30J_07670 [Paludibacteraceae bacterium]